MNEDVIPKNEAIKLARLMGLIENSSILMENIEKCTTVAIIPLTIYLNICAFILFHRLHEE
jgi:hypothetical protein